MYYHSTLVSTITLDRQSLACNKLNQEYCAIHQVLRPLISTPHAHRHAGETNSCDMSSEEILVNQLQFHFLPLPI